MSYIIVATDFSEVSENAIHYAIQLAGKYNLPVTILHSFIIPVTFGDSPMPVMGMDEAIKMAEERMGLIMQTFSERYPNAKISSKIMFGDMIDSIEEYTQNGRPELIVVGNSGTDDAPLWLGSNALDALRKLTFPVMAVPLDANYKEPIKVCLACDYKNITDHFQATNLIKLIELTGASLHILNVDFQHVNYTAETTLESSKLHMMLRSVNPVYHYIEKDNTEVGIQEFIASNNIDWLIVIPHKHTLFESIFHKSHTKAIMKQMHIPLIAIHEK